MTKKKEGKYRKLGLSILLDAVGVITSTWVIPLLGDFGDIIWAPLAGYIMLKMYKGKPGQIAGLVTFVEEAIPGLDIIPTFTLMWLYTYVFKKDKLAKVIERE